jgi:hypothetical protein
MTLLEQVLMIIVGLFFVAGGGFIARCALDSKNLIETAFFGLIGVGSGLFLIICALFGPPSY